MLEGLWLTMDVLLRCIVHCRPHNFCLAMTTYDTGVICVSRSYCTVCPTSASIMSRSRATTRRCRDSGVTHPKAATTVSTAR